MAFFSKLVLGWGRMTLSVEASLVWWPWVAEDRVNGHFRYDGWRPQMAVYERNGPLSKSYTEQKWGGWLLMGVVILWQSTGNYGHEFDSWQYQLFFAVSEMYDSNSPDCALGLDTITIGFQTMPYVIACGSCDYRFCLNRHCTPFSGHPQIDAALNESKAK